MTLSGPRIGSLCSVHVRLGMTVRPVFGGSVLWHCEFYEHTS
ncbi:hypothetical protein ACIQ6V_18200 [Streptomyces sp. NPDC096198]